MKREIEQRFSLLGGINAHSPMSADEVLSIESLIGERLPEDFREFLQTYGAASFGELVDFRLKEPTPIYKYPGLLAPTPSYERAPFSHFYGSMTDKRSLAKRINDYKGRIPESLMPIGDDGAGNQICIGIKGPERDRIYYWDHENDPNDQEYFEDHGEPMPPEVKFQNVYLVADSFEGFIYRLHQH